MPWLGSPERASWHMPSSLAPGGTSGFILVTFDGLRPMPPNTSGLRFTGSATLGSAPLFTASRPPQPRVLLGTVPFDVKVLAIEYLDGSALVGLFEGHVNAIDVNQQFPREGRLRVGSHAEILLPDPGNTADTAPTLAPAEERRHDKRPG